MRATIALPLLVLLASTLARAKAIETNELSIQAAPDFISTGRVQAIVDKIQKFMEWDIRKIHVFWYSDPAAFGKIHGFGPSVLAFARRSDQSVHVGPSVNDKNFDETFTHELTHIIVFQKYKDSIPSWLDEGLANYAADMRKLDYAWLALQPARDVHTLIHPFNPAGGADGARYTYAASTALMEMIASKCSVHDLLQLSVGKKLETYLGTFCNIEDLNAAFLSWIKRQAGRAKKLSTHQ